MKLSVGKLNYYPFKGFVARDFRLCGSVPLSDGYILKAEQVVIDLDFLALLAKCIKINRLILKSAQFNLGRDASGVWNISSLLESDIFKPGPFSFVLNELRMTGGVIDYEDLYQEDDTLRRRFIDVKLVLTTPVGKPSHLEVVGHAQNTQEESLGIELDFDLKHYTLSGRVELNTPYLNQYWDYYLDKLMKPWYLRVKEVRLGLNISYAEGMLGLDGEYKVIDGKILYGDLSFSGNSLVRHSQKFVKADPAQNYIRLDIFLDKFSSASGKAVFLEKAECKLLITEDTFTIEKIEGLSNKRKVNLSGSFKGKDPREVYLSGKIADVENTFLLKILPDNKGILKWHSEVASSLLDIRADITDLKSHAFNLSAEGSLRLADLSELLMVNKSTLDGQVTLKGALSGELDKPQSLQGRFDLKAKGFSCFGLSTQDFTATLKAKNGFFHTKIPPVGFYKGSLSAEAQFDASRWGIELNAQNLDLKELGLTSSQYKNIKGTFWGNIAGVAEWKDFNSICGGGYIKLLRCDLRNTPIFTETEKGIASVKKDFTMPAFDLLTGNFEIQDKAIEVENAICRAHALDLGIRGKYDFSGNLNMTIAATVLGGDALKTIRQILLPQTIGFDMLANSICVNVNGRWPSLQNKTGVQPIGWVNEFSRLFAPIKQDKFKLKQIWAAGGAGQIQ